MEKFWTIFILEIIIIFPFVATSQNLLLNGDFENVHKYRNENRRIRNTFYAQSWFESTNGTVDIIRDLAACDLDHTKSFEPDIDFCINTKSGDYCIGFIPLTFLGYMEHLTGTFDKELKKGSVYKISFFLKKQYSEFPFIPNGIGFSLHKDSLFFDKKLIEDIDMDSGKPWAYYDNLFKSEKIIADFEIDNYVLDTSWVKYKFLFKARGEERFITFGKFAYEKDKKIMKQLKKIRVNPWDKKICKFIKKGKSLVNRKFFKGNKIEDSSCYYFLDSIEVVLFQNP